MNHNDNCGSNDLLGGVGQALAGFAIFAGLAWMLEKGQLEEKAEQEEIYGEDDGGAWYLAGRF